MIGRATFGRPWISGRYDITLIPVRYSNPPWRKRPTWLCSTLTNLLNTRKEPAILEMRRHFSNYFKGLPGFKETRLKLLTSTDVDEIRSIIGEIREKMGEGRYGRSTGIYGI